MTVVSLCRIATATSKQVRSGIDGRPDARNGWPFPESKVLIMPIEDSDHLNSMSGTLDWSKAMKSVEGDRDLLRDVADAFFEECPDLVSRLRTSVEEGDADGLQRAAHMLKSSLRTFGAEKGFELAEKLEEMGQQKQVHEAAPVFTTLQQEVEQVIGQLTAFVNDREGSNFPNASNHQR